MKNVFFSKDGRQMPSPETREEAVKIGFPTYYVFGRCEKCQWSLNHQIYVDNGECKSCILKEATATKIMYNHLMGRVTSEDIISMEEQHVWVQPNIGGNVKPWKVPSPIWDRIVENVIMVMGDSTMTIENTPCKEGGHVLIKQHGKCYFCKQKSSPRQTAIANNEKWYTPVKPCKVCNTVSPRSTATGRCKKCQPEKEMSSRQIAIANGEQWYTPTTPCEYCHKIAPKRVNNGQCQGCSPESVRAEISPRKEALMKGEKWYKPEEECPKCGTHALRYVANGRCKGCNDGEELQRLRK